MKVFLSWSFGTILIWLYYEKPSIDHSISCPTMRSIIVSLYCIWKSSLGQSFIRSLKFVHIQMPLVDLMIETIFKIHFVLMNPTCSNICSSTLIRSTIWKCIFFNLYLEGLTLRDTTRLSRPISRYYLGISTYDKEKLIYLFMNKYKVQILFIHQIYCKLYDHMTLCYVDVDLILNYL